MTASYLLDKSITFSMKNPNFREIFTKKNPGTFLVVVSTGDTRIG